MPAVTCPDCGSRDIDRGDDHEDGRWYVHCLECGREWLRGEPRPVAKPAPSIGSLRRRFPKAEDAHEGQRAATAALKAQFLEDRPQPAERVAPYWARYQHIFSAEGLRDCEPQDLKDFANTTTGANPGNMSVFNRAWNELGVVEAAARTRAAIEYLLRGPDSVPAEDRLSQLILGDTVYGMTGFRESLLTKVLCIMEPDRFLPILMYTGTAGKREIAGRLYGVPLPAPESTTWTKGRLIYWSNDLLLELAGQGFVSPVHAAEFLWWASEEQSATSDG